jgi:hypothetical protein
MKLLLMLTLVGSLLAAVQPPGPERWLKPYRWEKRIILIFDHSQAGSLFPRQLAQAEDHAAGYQDRDLVQFQITPEAVITPAGERLGPEAAASFYAHYQVDPAGFAAILIGKDGGEKLRRSDELLGHDLLFRTIDAMPMRQREMRKKP